VFADPVLDGLWRAAKLPSNFGDRAAMMKNLFDGVAFHIVISPLRNARSHTQLLRQKKKL